MRELVAKVAALTLATAGALATAGPAEAHGDHPRQADHHPTVLVRGNGTVVRLSDRNVDEGLITFKVQTTNTRPGGSQITLFRLVGHATLATFRADLRREFSPNPATAARGTRELNRDIRAFGLADVIPHFPARVTERLTPGMYYLMDLGNIAASGPDPVFTSLRVRDSESRRDSAGRQGARSHHRVIKLTSADRFVSPRRLPARGTVTVKNVSDTIHFMAMAPVKKGTTDAQVQAYFDSGSQTPPSFAVNGPSIGLDVLSPGRQADFTYGLPRGTYVLLCFVADDRTGKPHALMGMHKVVILQ